jgi:hypothetical protein
MADLFVPWQASTAHPGEQEPQPYAAYRFLCYIILMDRVVRWYRSARRHRVGKAHAMHVITTTRPEQVPATDIADARLVWIGSDDRGVELEIVALDLEDAIVVIHVMPTSLRR